MFFGWLAAFGEYSDYVTANTNSIPNLIPKHALIEFKLASNSKLKQNLAKQVEVYENANNTKKAIKVILYFDNGELRKVNKILKELKIDNNQNIILIDAGRKISASNVK